MNSTKIPKNLNEVNHGNFKIKNHKNRSKNLKMNSKEKKLQIWYTNADVLTREKLNELKDFIDSSNAPDIIAITEIKPKNYKRVLSKSDYKLKGYLLEPVNLNVRNSTRGIAVYIRDTLNYDKINTEKLKDNLKSDISPKEILSLIIDLKNGQKLNFIVMYRSPNNDDINNNKINKFFKNAINCPYDHQIIVGDFNRKEIDWTNMTSKSSEDYDFIEAVRDSYLTQHIKSPTRGRGTDQPSTLDLLFTSREDAIESIKIESPLGKSDHSLIQMKYQFEPENQRAKILFDHLKGDYEKMKEILSIGKVIWQKVPAT